MKTAAILRMAHAAQAFAGDIHSWDKVAKRDLPSEDLFAQRQQNADELAQLLAAIVGGQGAVNTMMDHAEQLLRLTTRVYGVGFAQDVHDMAHRELGTTCDGCALGAVVEAVRAAQSSKPLPPPEKEITVPCGTYGCTNPRPASWPMCRSCLVDQGEDPGCHQ